MNFLWITTDQQRFDTIAALGNPHIRTPNFDRLVAEGTAFTHAFCQSPMCNPSRASFMTGMYPGTIRCSINQVDYWPAAAPVVTGLLADAGRECGLAGKLNLAYPMNRVEPRPADDGFSVFHWSHSPRDRWPPGVNQYVEWAKANGGEFGGKENTLLNPTPELHQTTWCADRAIEFMEARAGSPWLMCVNIFDPHKPFDPPREYLDRYDPDEMPLPLFRETDIEAQKKLAAIDFQTPPRDPETLEAKRLKAAYYAMIELVDHNIGRMLDSLERTGQRENTLVVFTSDHGEMLGDHGLLLKGCRFYEGLVRVPLIFSCPGTVGQGVVSDALVELIDIAPTLLEAAGADIPEAMQGHSLWPKLTGEESTKHHRDFVRSEFYCAIKPRPGKYVGTWATMLRDERYKIVIYHTQDLGELYDLKKDPGEFDNLWDDPDYAGLRFRLMKQAFDSTVLAIDIGPQHKIEYPKDEPPHEVTY